MINSMFGLIGTVVVPVITFVGGAVFSYLFLRANPNKKAVLDAEIPALKAKIAALEAKVGL